MKALTLYEPWATLIALGYKRWETRPGTILWDRYRGPLAIHAGKAEDDIEGVGELWERAFPGMPLDGELEPAALRKTLGHVLCVVDMVRAFRIMGRTSLQIGAASLTVNGQVVARGGNLSEVQITASFGTIMLSRAADAFGDFSPGRKAIELTNVRRLATPVRERGYQGLWETSSDGHRRIMEQIGLPATAEVRP